MYLETGSPMRGTMRMRVQAFLNACGLDWDEGISYTCALVEDDEIIACGSLDGATIKCIAVSPMHQGEDLASRILTDLRREAFERGLRHLMLFTKPKNERLFAPLGFSPVQRADDVLLMETERHGLENYIAALERPQTAGENVGAIVANCNPMTNGHLHLIRTAAEVCDVLHLFILSEEKGEIPAADRMRLVREVCADMKNVCVHPTGPYMISSATFPAYFLREQAKVERAYCDLDIRIFAERIAPALGIRKRFVGAEPYSRVTEFYNEQLKRRLPEAGIELIEIPRLSCGGEPVSASRVRALWREEKFEEIRPLTPECVYLYLKGE